MRALGIAVSALTMITATAAFGATADMSGIWSSSDRNFTIPAANQNVPGGPVKGPVNRPPYRPDWAARYQQMMEAARAGKATLDPTARCLPAGMPRTMATPFPMEISVEKKRVLIMFEVGGVRRIATDGAQHPSKDDLDPTYLGDSVGHWEGDTLVVDTVGLRGESVFDATGAPHSDQMHLIERIRLLSKDKLEDHITVEDPVAFTKPWEIVHTYDRKPAWHIMEFVCEENNRDFTPDEPAPASDAPRPK